MANANIQSFPLLGTDQRDIRQDDTLLLLRRGFPYRYVISDEDIRTPASTAGEFVPRRMTLPNDINEKLHSWIDIEYELSNVNYFARLPVTMFSGPAARTAVRLPGTTTNITVSGNTLTIGGGNIDIVSARLRTRID